VSAADTLFSRDEALGGLPARRAATLLFLIESRTAHLADQERRAGDFLASEDAARERDLAFFEAFSAGREPPVAPTIPDLERHAARWAPLVPANPALRAAVAHLLGRKYVFTRRAVPGIRDALSLDGESVARAYRRQYGADIETIYATQLRVRDWLPWAWAALSARVDALSPFWLTFGLTIAFGFSQAFLALPTGVARVGAGPGVVLVLVIGCINVLTMACMAEACARSGDFRYGRAFLGRLVVSYLGREAAAFFSAMTAVRTFLVMLAGTIGIGLTLAAFTGIRAEVWMLVLVLAELCYLSRKSAAATITTMFSLIGLNLLCLAAIAALALGRVEAANPAARRGRRHDALHRPRVRGPVRADRTAPRSRCARIDPGQRGRHDGADRGLRPVGAGGQWGRRSGGAGGRGRHRPGPAGHADRPRH
jgi:hypothetical protein